MKYTDFKEFDAVNMFGTGEENIEWGKFFQGKSFINTVLRDPEMPIGMMNVTFEPGCRNAWHTHKASTGGGQILICTAGEGWYQEEGKAPVSLTPGTVVSIHPNVKHWHGAKKDSWFSHISVEVPGENQSTDWFEIIDDVTYNAL